jgi:hypothetical protein
MLDDLLSFDLTTNEIAWRGQSARSSLGRPRRIARHPGLIIATAEPFSRGWGNADPVWRNCTRSVWAGGQSIVGADGRLSRIYGLFGAGRAIAVNGGSNLGSQLRRQLPFTAGPPSSSAPPTLRSCDLARLCTVASSSAGSTGLVKWFWNPARKASMRSSGLA